VRQAKLVRKPNRPREVAVKEKKTKRKTNSPAAKANTPIKGTKARRATANEKAKAKSVAKSKAKSALNTKTAKTSSNKIKKTEPPKEKIQVVIPKLAYKGTFNTHDIMHAPVEKTIKMLEKIIAGERLFTM
jgi:hypothetical protein